MRILAGIVGFAVIAGVLWEAFETVVLPRRVTRHWRFARVFYRTSWRVWSTWSSRIGSAKRRESYLSYYGPLSLLALFVAWALLLVLGFALLHWATGSSVTASNPGLPAGFLTDLYMSGTTFFTLGLGDVIPRSTVARFITVTESGMGFGFLALVIGYVPILYQSFSRREATITLMDARAGSPPSAVELFRRHSSDDGHRELRELFRDWERWSADILESHLSYPVLCYYRSQHDNENWLATLTTILDACALVIVGIDDDCRHQAQLTFAMARHTVVDLSQIFLNKPEVKLNRLSDEQILGLRTALAEAGWRMQEGVAAEEHLIELRKMYEPFVAALGAHMRFSIPGWFPPQHLRDNWQTSAWGRITSGVANPSVCEKTKVDGHF